MIQVSTAGRPFASYIFRYRTTSENFHCGLLAQVTYNARIEALKNLGIVPSTPSPTPPRAPTPLCDRDETTLSDSQVREALTQLQRRRQEELRVKHEREESEERLVGHGSDEVEWMKTMPAESVRKRLRRLPTATDEVVDLDDN